MCKLVNGNNYYNDHAFNQMCSLLESGETIHVMIDCIGHTRNNREQEIYRKELTTKYKDRLEVLYRGGYSYSYEYKLI